MRNSRLVNTHSHTAVAEHGQRRRMVEIRDRIFESQILDSTIAMAQTGKDLLINQDTMKLEEVGTLDQKTRSDYIKLLSHKLISNAQVPKEIKEEPSSTEKWCKVIQQLEAVRSR